MILYTARHIKFTLPIAIKNCCSQMKQEEEEIFFYGKTRPEYIFLSNFYQAPFKITGIQYKTNEHFFQSKKFQGLAYEQEIINAQTPKQAKSLGRKFKMVRPQEWPQKKEQIMLCGLRAKFGQNPDIKEKLLATGTKVLRQHTGRDKYWGDGGKKFTGKNRLGVLLMKVRQEIRKSSQVK